MPVNFRRWHVTITQASHGQVNPKPKANRKGQRWRRRTGPRQCQIFYQTPVGDITPHTRAAPVLFDRFRFLLLLLLVFSWNASWWPPHKAMRGAAKKAAVEGASEELERRSQYLSSLIQRTKVKSEADQDKKEVVEAAAKSERRELHDHSQHLHHHQEPRQRKQKEDVEDKQEEEKKGIKDGDGFDGDPPQEQRQPPNVKVRAADMPLALQKRAFKCARETLASMPKLESKRLACALKKEFDSTYGPAWHCIVGTSFGSYVTHSLGGFLYFSIDKVYILLFRTAVEPIDR
ncbi:uncharacterized protein LOC135642619 isoform X2 [Musa acuminata AAA Group]|uniref:uncharacterized protein LOC135642619 isoform X2 n=1 Tax=Musa acuminata AAA Group TaxID=214697 RepID=UPI0031D09711